MNVKRRNIVKNIIKQIGSISDQIEEVKDDEQEAFDNLPENFQDGKKGQDIVMMIDILEQAIDQLSDIVPTLEDI